MQRLNALISFIEGEFSLGNQYFDLDAMADTKLSVDQGKLIQKSPKLDREICAEIASYTLPLSIYRFDSAQLIDEIFRRINSNGKYLSRQELRQAGAIGHFAQLVRTISARIRGDVSASDILNLNAMQAISITNRDLTYGIRVDDIFWVQQNILRREDVRDSKDEELVSDILAYMALDGKPSTSSDILDDYFGAGNESGSEARFREVELAVQKISAEVLTAQYLRVHEAIRSVLSQSGKLFNTLMFAKAGVRVPRYYQAVFLAFFELIIRDNMEVSDRRKIVALLDGIGTKFMNVGGGGGKWSSTERQKNVNAVVGVIKEGFEVRGTHDPATYSWVTQFENILMQSFTEQNFYDFKQGLHRLDPGGTFEDELLHKIVKTLVAIANHGPGVTGYVLLGVAEDEATAKRIEKLYGSQAQPYNRFFVTGIEEEATKFHKNLDAYFQLIIQKLDTEPIPAAAKDEISRNIKLINYFDKSVVVFKITAGKEPYSYDKKFYVRKGPNIDEVSVEGYTELFGRFLK